MMEQIKMFELFDFIDKNIKQGYNVYSDAKDINALIDIIVNWYETKYPENIIQMSAESYNKGRLIMVPVEYDIRKIENLSKYMDYYQLMLRIPSNLYPIIECWYKSNRDECLGNSFKIYFCPKDSLNEATTGVLINKYDGHLSLSTSMLFNRMVKINCSTIEQLVEEKNYFKKVDYDEIDFSDPKRVVKTHNLDLEIRNKIFNLIAIKLLYSSNDIKVGYIRSKLFIEEFNKYIYDLNLQSTEIDEVIRKYNINEMLYYIKEDITREFSRDNPVDEFGLTFEELKNLKRQGINKIYDLVKKGMPSAIDIDFYSDKCIRDENIIQTMKEIAHTNSMFQNAHNALAHLMEGMLDEKIELYDEEKPVKKKRYKFK